MNDKDNLNKLNTNINTNTIKEYNRRSKVITINFI